ncbi:MAG: 2Fe-2S iron-sulfur cluster-binding protein [Bacteroidia bacterium]
MDDGIITIHVTDREDVTHELEAPTDMSLSLMEVIKSYELPVEGICGGMALCASCHCYVESDHDLPAMNESEEAMLDETVNVEDNSRLSCQIRIADAVDGLKVRLAPVD